jgi:hypothetical protein
MGTRIKFGIPVRKDDAGLGGQWVGVREDKSRFVGTLFYQESRDDNKRYYDSKLDDVC